MEEEILGKSYNLPKGEDDLQRLQKLHQIYLLLLNGLYPAQVEKTVRQLMRQHKPEILDVGCGSGPAWSVQMAQRFPNAKVVGLDFAPLYRGWNYPPNFSFRRYDLVNGLPPEYKGRFSLIHCRTCCQHVPDPPMLVETLSQCLRPGGLLLLSDADFLVYGEDKMPLPLYKYNPSLSIQDNLSNQEGLSWHAAFFWETGRVMRSPKYEPPSNLIRKTPLSIVLEKEFLLPCGWEGEGIKNGKQLGPLLNDNFENLYEFSPKILAKLDDIPVEYKEALRSRGLEGYRTGLEKTYIFVWYTAAIKIKNAL